MFKVQKFHVGCGKDAPRLETPLHVSAAALDLPGCGCSQKLNSVDHFFGCDSHVHVLIGIDF
jgi:hypothetical protein